MPLRPNLPIVFDGTGGNPLLLTVDGAAYRGSYASIADVQALFVTSDSLSRVLTNATLVATLLADATDDLNRALDPLYVTPIQPNVAAGYTTATTALQHLNYIVKYFTAAEILDLIANATDAAPDVHVQQAVSHREKGAQRLDDIIRGVTQLFDAQERPGGERPLWPAGAIAHWNLDVDAPPYGASTLASAPLFGVRADPPFRTYDWIP